MCPWLIRQRNFALLLSLWSDEEVDGELLPIFAPEPRWYVHRLHLAAVPFISSRGDSFIHITSILHFPSKKENWRVSSCGHVHRLVVPFEDDVIVQQIVVQTGGRSSLHWNNDVVV